MDGNQGIDRAPWTPSEVAALAALVVGTGAILRLMGQPWWCSVGDLAPWTSSAGSVHTSQHLADPYTLTHVLHGVAFYAILWLVAGTTLSVRLRFFVAMVAESAWEIFENTDFVINRYREATISLDYFGDSVLNSLGDIVACALGFALAATVPVAASALFFVGVEVLLMVWIRDSLILNIVMLVWPIEAIKNWQMGG